MATIVAEDPPMQGSGLQTAPRSEAVKRRLPPGIPPGSSISRHLSGLARVRGEGSAKSRRDAGSACRDRRAKCRRDGGTRQAISR